MTCALQTYWRELASGTRIGILDKVVLALLIPFSLIYSTVLRLRAAMYQSGIFKVRKLPRPVISIGNLTVGGTGKTPASALIARELTSKGLKVALLSRGYGGSLEGKPAIVSDGKQVLRPAAECGDEPYLLANSIPGLIVVTGSDRYAAGILAMQELSPDIFLLDDGFQHMRLHRDLNILLQDYNRPYGNGWTLPAGMLREPQSAMQRADLIIRTRVPTDIVSAAPQDVPVCMARHELTDLVPLSGGSAVAFNAMLPFRVVAFAGIAEPQLFFDSLKSLGLNPVATIALPDHAVYDAARIGALQQCMLEAGAEFALTTEKDGVKLGQLPNDLSDRIMLARLSLTLLNPAPLQEKLRNLL